MSLNCDNKEYSDSEDISDSEDYEYDYKCNNNNYCKQLLPCVRGNICLFKTLLNKCTLQDQRYTIFNFDITVINKMCYKVSNVSIVDALVGLQYVCKDITFDIVSSHSNLVPLQSDDIKCSRGELLDAYKSYLPPKSASRLILKITVGLNTEIDDNCVDCSLNVCCNSVTLNGIIRKSDGCDEKLEPINICSKVLQ